MNYKGKEVVNNNITVEAFGYCPFCGEVDRLQLNLMDDRIYLELAHIRCQNCRMEMYAESNEELLDKWNTRVLINGRKEVIE